ncbi:MAG TPA: hypothetical protein VGQ82_00975 [Chthoniobacterales bacterium]|nr:hypothetical protein [Chthoniobacterales bacterium]
MSVFEISRKQRALAQCAPITEKSSIDRATRVAVQRARHGKRAAEFARQETFDRAVATLVQMIPVGPEVAEWFANESLVPVTKRTWRTIASNPAVLAIALAVAVIAGIFAYRVHEHMLDFPGAASARKLLIVASSTRSVLLDPVQTEAGALGDLFFMKHRLEHYDVAPEFVNFKTIGCRVFDDEEVHRVAQIYLLEKRMQLFLFPAENDPKHGIAPDFDNWRYVEQEGWTGAVRQQNGICFMAAIRGTERDLLPYLNKEQP